jgi:hypothetical protein
MYEAPDIRARLNLKTFVVEEAAILSDADGPFELRHAAWMAILYTALKGLPIFA